MDAIHIHIYIHTHVLHCHSNRKPSGTKSLEASFFNPSCCMQYITYSRHTNKQTYTHTHIHTYIHTSHVLHRHFNCRPSGTLSLEALSLLNNKKEPFFLIPCCMKIKQKFIWVVLACPLTFVFSCTKMINHCDFVQVIVFLKRAW